MSREEPSRHRSSRIVPPRSGRDCGLSVKVWDTDAIAEGGLGGLLGVNRDSTLPPRLLELTYDPQGPKQGTLALVGKGIVFDAGGLSIKPIRVRP